MCTLTTSPWSLPDTITLYFHWQVWNTSHWSLCFWAWHVHCTCTITSENKWGKNPCTSWVNSGNWTREGWLHSFMPNYWTKVLFAKLHGWMDGPPTPIDPCSAPMWFRKWQPEPAIQFPALLLISWRHTHQHLYSHLCCHCKCQPYVPGSSCWITLVITSLHMTLITKKRSKIAQDRTW